eukprot:COSAG06_NODE_806_length_12168_cov_195.038615_11_plen_183_part_00
MACPSTLGANSFLTAVGGRKMRQSAWAFAKRLWPKPSALAPSASPEDRAQPPRAGWHARRPRVARRVPQLWRPLFSLDLAPKIACMDLPRRLPMTPTENCPGQTVGTLTKRSPIGNGKKPMGRQSSWEPSVSRELGARRFPGGNREARVGVRVQESWEAKKEVTKEVWGIELDAWYCTTHTC